MDPIYVEKSNQAWTCFRQHLNDHFRTLRNDLDQTHLKIIATKCNEYKTTLSKYEQENKAMALKCSEAENKLAAAEKKLNETTLMNAELSEKYARIRQRYGELQTECKILLNRNNRITSLLASESFTAGNMHQSMLSFDMHPDRNHSMTIKRQRRENPTDDISAVMDLTMREAESIDNNNITLSTAHPPATHSTIRLSRSRQLRLTDMMRQDDQMLSAIDESNAGENVGSESTARDDTHVAEHSIFVAASDSGGDVSSTLNGFNMSNTIQRTVRNRSGVRGKNSTDGSSHATFE